MSDMVEVHSLADLAGPDAERQWSLSRRVYAAAHDLEPWQVDDTDGSFEDVCHILAEEDYELSGKIADALNEWRAALGIQERGTGSG